MLFPGGVAVEVVGSRGCGLCCARRPSPPHAPPAPRCDGALAAACPGLPALPVVACPPASLTRCLPAFTPHCPTCRASSTTRASRGTCASTPCRQSCWTSSSCERRDSRPEAARKPLPSRAQHACIPSLPSRSHARARPCAASLARAGHPPTSLPACPSLAPRTHPAGC